MGWIERMQNPRSGKSQDMLARRVAKGLGFSLNNLSQVERNLGIQLPDEASFTEHMEIVLQYASKGAMCCEGSHWVFKWFADEVGPKTYQTNKAKWLKWVDGKAGVIILGRQSGDNDCVAYVVVPEDNVHDSLRLPVCTLLDKDQGKLVFVKEVSNFIHDFATVEGWLN